MKDMTLEELLTECKRRGFLDKNGKYVCRMSKRKIKHWFDFLKEKNLTLDEALGLLQMASEDSKMRVSVLKIFEEVLE